ncbi:MAG TPA: hypothetical protein PK156_30430 [Polyangium sp.]|nr:hypothetical protein [Polyangium sp.]
MKTITSPSIAIWSLVLGCLPTAHAAQEVPAASASAAAAAPSGSASAPPGGMAISAYKWPREASGQPKEEEWAGATELESMTTQTGFSWERFDITCRTWAVREWVRLECALQGGRKSSRDFPHFFGSLWGLAGDISGVSGQFRLASKVDQYASKLNPADEVDRLQLGMGAAGIVTFQAKYGSAVMLRLDEIFWAEQYDGGGNVLVDPGILIDIGWALGEQYPTISVNG